MKQRTSSLPVVVVIAVIALVLGSIGTAVAAPALTKSKVKKIATKVVKKEAPTLSVANAANAANLNGQPAATYLDRAASAFTPDLTSVAVPANTPTQLLGPVSLTVPNGSFFVNVLGSTGLLGAAPANAALWLMVDAPCAISGVGFTHRGQFSVDTTTQPGLTTAILAITPGVHTFRLCVESSGAATAYGSALTVETVATGSTGGSAPKPPAESSSHGSPTP